MKAELTVEPIRPADLGDVDQLHDIQEIALGHKVDRPNLLASPVLASLGVKKEGELVGGFYVEAVGELCFIGVAPEATAMAKDYAEDVYTFLRDKGIRWLTCVVPKKGGLSETLQPSLESCGLRKITDEYDVYRADLRPVKTDGGS